MLQFLEYMEKTDKETIDKIKTLYELLKKDKDMEVKDFTEDENNPFIFVKTPLNSEVYEILSELNIGIKIFNIGEKLVYRLYHGPRGVPIGPSKVLEDHEDIATAMQSGKSEQEAYEDLYKSVSEKLKKFTEKVLENLESKIGGMKPPLKMDAPRDREILNSIVSVLF